MMIVILPMVFPIPRPTFNPRVSIRDVGRIVCWCMVSFVVAIAVFVGVLAAGIALPSDSRIAANLKTSFDKKLLTEDSYGMSPYGHTGHRFDTFSECIGLGMNLANADRSVLYRVAASPYVASDVTLPAGVGSSSPCADLLKGANGELKADLPYFRFWHGYQVYTRALLSVMDVGGLRIANAILLFGALLFLSFELRGWFGAAGLAVFLLAYAIGTDLLTLPLVTVHALPMAWTFFTAAVAMKMLERQRRHSLGLFVFVFVSGCVYNFISMLFAPELVPALLAFVSLTAFMRWDANRLRRWDALLAAGGLAATWFAGFGLTWLMKWPLAAVYLGWGAVRQDVGAAAAGVHYTVHIPGNNGLLLPMMVVANVWLGKLIMLANAGAIYMLIARRMRTRKKQRWGDLLLLQSPILILIAWVETLRYHTMEHMAFAQRAWILWLITPILGAILVMRDSDRVPRSA